MGCSEGAGIAAYHHSGVTVVSQQYCSGIIVV